VDRYPRPDAAALAAGVAVAMLAPAGVALLRLFPALVPDQYGLGWLLPAAGGIAAAGVAAATLASLERGLRRGSTLDIARATALALLAVGLGVATLRAVAPLPAGMAFPDAGLVPAAIGAGTLLLAAQFAHESLTGRVARPAPIGTWLVVFGVVEAAAAAAVLLPPAGALWPWLMGVAAALVAASAVPGPMLAAGLTASGLAALAASRTGSVEVVLGLVALTAGALAYGRGRAPLRAVADAVADGAREAPDATPATETLDVPAALTAREESMRLARELRGTIEELMQARRTVELQRGEIAQSATVDELTGVATRRAILERLKIEAGEARRYPHPVAVVLLDLDGFAGINRDHGLAVGDEVLREVALRLRLRMRSADALGRVGGDSFLALLPHTDETGAATFADALRGRILSRPIGTSAGEVVVRVSIGVAFMRAGMGLSDEELLAAADEALASARAAGGNRIAFDRMHGLIRLEERRADPGSA
jgi:diguanylate cyclase (GGDEF)-like protein